MRTDFSRTGAHKSDRLAGSLSLKQARSGDRNGPCLENYRWPQVWIPLQVAEEGDAFQHQGSPPRVQPHGFHLRTSPQEIPQLHAEALQELYFERTWIQRHWAKACHQTARCCSISECHLVLLWPVCRKPPAVPGDPGLKGPEVSESLDPQSIKDLFPNLSPRRKFRFGPLVLSLGAVSLG